MKCADILRKNLSKQPIFSTHDVKKLLPSTSKEYVYLLLHNLLQKKEMYRISSGIYSFHEEMIIVGFAYSPFYYGLQQALSIHGLWEQEVNPVVITPRKVRDGMRKFEGNNYFIRRVSRDMFFGYEMIKYSGFWVPVSDVEKTLIDMVYYRQYIGKELEKEFRKRVDSKKLCVYLKRVPKKYHPKIAKTIPFQLD